MDEFKVIRTDTAGLIRERRIRLTLWVAVLLLAGIALFAIYGSRFGNHQWNLVLVWVSGLIVAGVIVCAYSLAFSHAIEAVKRETVFLLTDKDLVRRRAGWPDVRMAFSEIKVLREGEGRLIVESIEPRRIIRIPAEVDGFQSLRATLTKYGLPVTSPQRPVSGLITAVGYLVCWGFALWSKIPALVITAGVTVLILLGADSIRIYRKLNHQPKRLLLALWFSFRWMVTIAIIYLRVVRS